MESSLHEEGGWHQLIGGYPWFRQPGAFPLPAGSKDAALLITLQPGSYTVVVTGVGNTTGNALVEIYDTQ